MGEARARWQLIWLQIRPGTEVLRRIRAAKGGVASAEAARAGWSAIERGYRRAATRSREVVLELLEDRLRDYDARVVRAVHVDVRYGCGERCCGARGERMVVPRGLTAEWLPAGVEFVVDDGLAADELDGLMA